MPTSDLSASRLLGRTSLLVSPLCLGGNVFGWTADRDTSFRVLDAYADAGGNFIDTADVYSEWVPGNSGGESETIIGEWLRSRGNRDRMVIATKVGKLSDASGLAPENIRRAVDQSLTRLRTDYIDLYYAHRDDADVPVEQVLTTFDELVAVGKVRHLGASNFSPDRLRESLETSRATGLAAYCAIQDNYNLVDRADYESGLEPIVVEHGLASLPFYGLARGYLTGKYRAGAVVDSPRATAVQAYMGARGDRVLAALDSVASAHGTTMGAVALAWLLTRPGVAAPLASARTTAQLDDLLAMGTLSLAPHEVDALTVASG